MSSLDDSKQIFQQLAHADAAGPGGGVHTVIENHDAWSQNGAILSQLSLALRSSLGHAPRGKPTAQRIAIQRGRLRTLATILPARLPAVG
jgi:hypothetical protein